MARKSKIEAAAEAVLEARERQAIEAEAMGDTVEIGGVTFYRPTAAHVWVITAVTQHLRAAERYDQNLVMAYILAHSPQETLNRVSRELRKTPGEMVFRAEAFLASHGLDPVTTLPEVAKLMQDLRSPGEAKAPAASRPAGGADSSTE